MARNNKVFLLGNVGKDPYVKDFSNGKVARITLATTEKGYTKQDGTKIEAPPSTSRSWRLNVHGFIGYSLTSITRRQSKNRR